MGPFTVALLLCLAGAGAALVLPASWRVLVSAMAVAAGCVVAGADALAVAAGHHTVSAHVGAILPLTGVDMTLDPLAALFVLITSVVGLATCVYVVGYARGVSRSRASTSLFAVFVLSLLVVPAASSVATLLGAWEVMALSSLALIALERRTAATSAALWYGALTQAGAAAILLGLLVLAGTGSGQTFVDLAAHASTLSPAVRSLGFLLCLVGFASKAGSVPLHVWLPRAHPEAPSHVSALMSGAMVTTGVYGIVRVGGDLLRGGSPWWWVVVVALGVASALFGALHATTSTDLKRLLAYSTIDVVGLVLVGVGAAGVLADTGHANAARLALGGALFLLAAHGVFKAGLFLVAGSVERATGTRDLDRLGGLVHPLPVTTGLFTLLALAVMAVPALSGFSGEWLVLQGLVHGFADSSAAALICVLVGVVALALTAGLTVVAFVKALGIGFLGRPRSRGAADAHQRVGWMDAGVVVTLVPTVLLGVAPGLVTALVDRATRVGLAGRGTPALARGAGLTLARFRGAVAPALLVAVVVATVLAVWGVRSLVARRPIRRVEAWGSGRAFQTARMQYTATSFGEPLQRVFADVLRPDVDVEVTHVAESKYYEQAVTFQSRVDDAIERSLYWPLIRAVRRAGVAARRVPNGSVHRYLALGFGALLILLAALS